MNKLNKFIRSSAGRKFYNFAYCWGACFVILGAVFKIAHMPYDSVLLMIGLFTEVFIFFISGFDYPAEEYKWEKIFPALGRDSVGDKTDMHAVEEAEKAYKEKVEQLKASIDDMHKAYAEQTALINTLSSKIQPEAFEELMKETEETAALLKEMNTRFSAILSSMGHKQDSNGRL